MQQLPSASALLFKHLKQQIGTQQRLCVAFSGGLDSTVLVHALAQLRDCGIADISLRAIYIHHGLSRFADHWAAHCQQQCQRWAVEFQVIYVTVDARAEGIEAAARNARYQALAANLQVGETLVTAQHLNDQCETFLLALKRGSGPAGLSAMAASIDGAQYPLLRPLLSLSRQQLADYAAQQQLSWIEDDSNQDVRFDRNFLRLNVLPLLYQRWPHFAQSVARSASLCAEQEQLLDELLAETLSSLIAQDGSLAIDALFPMSAVRRFALIRRWLAQQGEKMPSREQLSRLWNEVAISRCDAEPQLQLGKKTLRRFRQRLYLLPMMAELQHTVLQWSLQAPLLLPDNVGCLKVQDAKSESAYQVCVRAPLAGEVVTVRFYTQGKVQIVGRQHAREMKKLWQELVVPPWQRTRIPLIFYNDQLIAAPGYFITQQGQVRDQTCCILWLKGN
jgi:tRNA(Ile)-lysidine synthase